MGSKASSAAKKGSIRSTDWSALPNVLLIHSLGFLPDHKSLVAAHSCCRLWRAVANAPKLDETWQTLYLSSFEPESAADEPIASDGPLTRWKKRFISRALIEQNWLNGRCTSRDTATIPSFDAVDRMVFLMSSNNLFVACRKGGTHVVVIDVASGKERNRIDVRSIPICLTLDDSGARRSAPRLAVGCANRDVFVLDLLGSYASSDAGDAGDEKQQPQQQPLVQPQPRPLLQVRAPMLALKGNLLASATLAESSARLWDARSGEPLTELPHFDIGAVITLEISDDERCVFSTVAALGKPDCICCWRRVDNLYEQDVVFDLVWTMPVGFAHRRVDPSRSRLLLLNERERSIVERVWNTASTRQVAVLLFAGSSSNSAPAGLLYALFRRGHQHLLLFQSSGQTWIADTLPSEGEIENCAKEAKQKPEQEASGGVARAWLWPDQLARLTSRHASELERPTCVAVSYRFMVLSFNPDLYVFDFATPGDA